MKYRSFNNTYYIRVDRGEEIISTILSVCKAENIGAAVYTGIGGCSQAEIQTFIPEAGAFETETIDGMLELASMTGNVVSGGHHTHAVISYKSGDGHRIAAGHIKSLTVLYTAEIELRPVTGGEIIKKHDPETGTGFWEFNDRDGL